MQQCDARDCCNYGSAAVYVSIYTSAKPVGTSCTALRRSYEQAGHLHEWALLTTRPSIAKHVSVAFLVHHAQQLLAAAFAALSVQLPSLSAGWHPAAAVYERCTALIVSVGQSAAYAMPNEQAAFQ
eukprot:14743-Heterococcus_DN1.PRE.3